MLPNYSLEIFVHFFNYFSVLLLCKINVFNLFNMIHLFNFRYYRKVYYNADRIKLLAESVRVKHPYRQRKC